MRIKPWVITAGAAAIATAAVGIIVWTTDPADVQLRMYALFWVALGIGAWVIAATLLLWCRMNLAQAVWVGFVWAIVALGLVLLWRSGQHDRRLLGGIVFATLCISFVVWRQFRHGRT